MFSVPKKKRPRYEYKELYKFAAKVRKGDSVKQGELLAYVGNSGRSPIPHIHFQIQATPFIGSETLDYPLHNYVIKSENKYKLITFGKPKTKQKIAVAASNKILEKALHLVSGKKFEISLDKNKKRIWEIRTNIWNQSYILDKEKNTSIYFYENESGLYFTNFYGDKESELFIFFQALYNVKKSFYKNTSMKSIIRPDLFFNKPVMIFQDFIAPFYIFLKSEYTLKYNSVDDDFIPDFVKLSSRITKFVFGKSKDVLNYDIKIYRSGKTEIFFAGKNKETKLLEITPVKKIYKLNTT